LQLQNLNTRGGNETFLHRKSPYATVSNRGGKEKKECGPLHVRGNEKEKRGEVSLLKRAKKGRKKGTLSPPPTTSGGLAFSISKSTFKGLGHFYFAHLILVD